MNNETITGLDCTEAIGPWPFTTRRTYQKPDRSHTVWRSRHHRKSLPAPEVSAAATTKALLRCLWMPRQLNWWIGVIFAIGSLLFALASVLSLAAPRSSSLPPWRLTAARSPAAPRRVGDTESASSL